MPKILVSRPFGKRDPKEGEPDFEEFEPTPTPKVHTRDKKETPPAKDTESWPTLSSEREKRKKEKSPTGTAFGVIE